MKLFLSILALCASYAVAKTMDHSHTKEQVALLVDQIHEKTNIPKDRRHLQVANEPCLAEFEFVTDGGCNFDTIVAFAIDLHLTLEQDGCPHDVLTELLIVSGKANEDELFEHLFFECFDFWINEEELPLEILGDDTSQFLKEFFDGGTYWNDARRTHNIHGDPVNTLQRDPGADLLEIGGALGLNHQFALPENIANFENCEIRSAMCCWVQDRQAGDDNGNCATPYDRNCLDADPADNTDVCYVDMSRAPTSSRTPSGFAVFPGETEGDVHCHGLAWSNSYIHPSSLFNGNNLAFVSIYDHLLARGYVRNVPGAPMCGCVEQMPVVSRADCTQIGLLQGVSYGWDLNGGLRVLISDEYQIEFNACQGVNGQENDLEAHYALLVEQEKAELAEFAVLKETVVGEGNCAAAIDRFFA